MSQENNTNFYEFTPKEGKSSFIFSQPDETGIGFNYFLLTTNESNEPVITHIPDAINYINHAKAIEKNSKKYIQVQSLRAYAIKLEQVKRHNKELESLEKKPVVEPQVHLNLSNPKPTLK